MTTAIPGTLKGIDTTDAILPSIRGLKYDGIQLVLKYTSSTKNFPNKAFHTLELKTLQDYGLRSGYLYEVQDDISMFRVGQSTIIADSILKTFERDKRKPGTICYVCADFEISEGDAKEVIMPTMEKIQQTVKAEGFLLGIYGEGFLCQLLKSAGIVHSDYVSESTSFPGSATYEDWDLKQFVGPVPFGLNADNLLVRRDKLQSLFPDPGI